MHHELKISTQLIWHKYCNKNIVFLLYIFILAQSAQVLMLHMYMLHTLFGFTQSGLSVFSFTVSVHPLLHGHCGSRFIHSLPAHLSGHLLLLQVMDSV